jgi:hypothetical protein
MVLMTWQIFLREEEVVLVVHVTLLYQHAKGASLVGFVGVLGGASGCLSASTTAADGA